MARVSNNRAQIPQGPTSVQEQVPKSTNNQSSVDSRLTDLEIGFARMCSDLQILMQTAEFANDLNLQKLDTLDDEYVRPSVDIATQSLLQELVGEMKNDLKTHITETMKSLQDKRQ